MKNEFRLTKVIVDGEHRCKDTQIVIHISRETAKELLAAVGKDFRSLSRETSTVSVAHGKENGNLYTCTLSNI